MINDMTCGSPCVGEGQPAELAGGMKLFRTGDGRGVTCDDMRAALRAVQADKSKVLFLHTDLSFGAIAPGLKRRQLCEALFGLVMELGVETVVFPTFTFSYCNREDFDVSGSPTKMGMLNEYARKRPEARRSAEPLLSVAVFGQDKGLLDVQGIHSIGEGSVFDMLHHLPGVRFLYLGTRPSLCSTHLHYVEEQLRVPYRYDMDFYGKLTGHDGVTREDHRILYVKYRDITTWIPAGFDERLVADGLAAYCPLGASGVYSITEEDFFQKTAGDIRRDVNVYLKEPYQLHPLVKEYRYGNVTHVY